MNWNFRVFHEENGDYIIREVFYHEDGSILGCTERAVEPIGRSIKDLAKHLEWFKEALALPVLTMADIPCKPFPKERNKRQTKNLSSIQVRAELGLA